MCYNVVDNSLCKEDGGFSEVGPKFKCARNLNGEKNTRKSTWTRLQIGPRQPRSLVQARVPRSRSNVWRSTAVAGRWTTRLCAGPGQVESGPTSPSFRPRRSELVRRDRYDATGQPSGPREVAGQWDGRTMPTVR